MQIREKEKYLNELRHSMNDYKSKLTDMYNRANTLSKKNRIAIDLHNFADLYRSIFSSDELMCWENDEKLELNAMLQENLSINNFLDYIDYNNDFYLKLTNKVIDDYSSVHYPFYYNYNKYVENMPRLSNKELLDIAYSFLSSYDEECYLDLKQKTKNLELLYSFDLGKNDGLTTNIECLDKNFISLATMSGNNIHFAKTLLHEYGHSFEYKLHINNSSNLSLSIFDVPFYEISSCFFEYAFLNYLKDNRICTDEVDLCLHMYFKEMFSYVFDVNLLSRLENYEINEEGNVIFLDEKINEYAHFIKEKINFYQLSNINDDIPVIEGYIYSIGMLFSIYLYEFYKDNKVLFKKNFKNSLCSYPFVKSIKAFENIGITEEKLLNSDLLVKTLKKQMPKFCEENN